MEIPKYIEMYRKDLLLKNYALSSIDNYVSQVKLFLHDHNRLFTEPAKVNEKTIKEWLLKAKSINSRKHKLSALKLFYHLTIKQPMKFKYIEYPKADKKLPIVLSVEEIQKMFSVCENLKHKVILSLLYSAGLRVSELINLKWQHIDRSRLVINIIAAKGNKDRQVMLTPSIVPLLEKYWNEYKSKEYVLNGWKNELQYSDRSVGEVIKQLADKAGINKRVYTHLIRHCSFTHLVEAGCDINLVQRLAGHSSIKTTNLYLHTSHTLISKIQSPLSQIKM
ncbi:MAG: tyrosine-type recombinase/integrase [Chitinophagaceae bacterium]|nr:tyrosine-type recombinase/integrase [Chitinophagaceae bacterium]